MTTPEPTRSVLIWKRDTHIDNEKETHVASPPTTSSPPARQAAAEAVELLRPHIADDPAFAAICEALSTTAPDTTEPDVDDADKIAKALIETDRIRKDENLPKETRDLADRGHRALQLEELAKVNPSEAWKYEQTHAA